MFLVALFFIAANQVTIYIPPWSSVPKFFLGKENRACVVMQLFHVNI